MRNTSRKKASFKKKAGRDSRSIARVVIAGLRGGSGKTTLSIGLARALRDKGLAVASFKKGPDYIDAGWLAFASGGPCYNLDPFLIGEEQVIASFVEHSRGSDLALIEGNRGLFDGMDASGSLSTAKVALMLKSPVLLIVDCSKMTRTAAALVQGVERFERGLGLAGVVLNQIAGQRHESVIRESIGKYCRAPVLGAIPRLPAARFPERHMGLTPWQEHPEVEAAIAETAELIEGHLDLEGILRAARRAPALGPPPALQRSPRAGTRAPRIGIIRDSAFQFYYPENLEELRKRGAELLDISALRDAGLPDIDALYIGGGFPETHAIALSENAPFRRGLLRAVKKGLPVYAECGGLMYLGKSLVVGQREYPMAGVFPVSFRLHERPQAHGYTVVKVKRVNPFYKKGTVLRGHEFHYSRALEMKPEKGLYTAFTMERGKGISGGEDGLCRWNVLATYTHLHALGSPQWAEGIMRAARRKPHQTKKPPHG